MRARSRCPVRKIWAENDRIHDNGSRSERGRGSALRLDQSCDCLKREDEGREERTASERESGLGCRVKKTLK